MASAPATLANDPQLPGRAILAHMAPHEASVLAGLPYDACITFFGTVTQEGTVMLRRAVRRPREERWEVLARQLGAGIHLQPFRLGAKGRPVVEVVVVFYETGMVPRKAVVHARQVEPVAGSSLTGAAEFFQITGY